MFIEFYHLREQPFGVTPDPRFLYFGAAHREALASLMYSIETRRGFSAMVAEPGMGKTTLLFRLLETLRATSRTAFLFQTEGDSRDLLRGVLADLGISVPSNDLAALHEALNGALLEEMRAGRQVVVVLDEAQNLDEKSLESVRLLSNFETSTQKLMHIVLAGQPKLGERLAGPDLKQLRQRVSTIIRVDPFGPEETEAYIDWRLRVAGHAGPPIFSPEALDLISRVSKGIPRNINSLCFQALSIGFATQSEVIGAEILREVVADLDPSPRPAHRANTPAFVPALRPAAVPVSDPTPASISTPPPAAVRPKAPVFAPAPAPARTERAASTPTMATSSIFDSWAIAPPAPERSFRMKGLAILACLVVPVLLVLGFSNPKLGLSGTAPGKLSGQAVNAVLGSSDPASDDVPPLPNDLKPPSAPTIQGTSAVSSTPSIADDANRDAGLPNDTGISNLPEQAALAPVAKRSAETVVPPPPQERDSSASPHKNSVVEVTHRENLFEFALENYGKSSRTIVDAICQLNPQISGPYDMLKEGEWIQLPSEPSALSSEERNR
jgi:type II secretory pathway predicted ATPase ExeA